MFARSFVQASAFSDPDGPSRTVEVAGNHALRTIAAIPDGLLAVFGFLLVVVLALVLLWVWWVRWGLRRRRSYLWVASEEFRPGQVEVERFLREGLAASRSWRVPCVASGYAVSVVGRDGEVECVVSGPSRFGERLAEPYDEVSSAEVE